MGAKKKRLFGSQPRFVTRFCVNESGAFVFSGNTPIGSPCGSPTLGRKQLASASGDGDQVLRNPRGPPDNATKGFQ